MVHRVNVVGILKANGKVAHYGEVLQDEELIDPIGSIRDGFTIDNDVYVKSQEQKKDLDAAAGADLLSKVKAKATE